MRSLRKLPALLLRWDSQLYIRKRRICLSTGVDIKAVYVGTLSECIVSFYFLNTQSWEGNMANNNLN